MFKDRLIDENNWNKFLNHSLKKDFLNNHEKKELQEFIGKKEYLDTVNKIYHHNYTFSLPQKHLINKRYGTKKRIVYTYQHDEMLVFKYIAYLLYDYDYLFSKNLYSFRKTIGVKKAINSLLQVKNIHKMYGYKVDIKNYFNSINSNILLKNLKNDIHDNDLYNLFSELLSNNKVIYNNQIIEEDKGVIAGCPISSFLANYYLKEVDEYFWQEKIFYLRYADDIIMFANTQDEILKCKDILNNFINKYQLQINTTKEYFYNPDDDFEFLGFSFHKKTIDISQNTLYKIKGKIKRSSKRFRKWMINNNIEEEMVLKAIIKKFNYKFFGNDKNELSWKYWFFPTINTSQSLKIIDQYFQQELRYIITGKHNKKNFKKVPYTMLKKCNYKSLVNEYYQLSFNMENKVQ